MPGPPRRVSARPTVTLVVCACLLALAGVAPVAGGATAPSADSPSASPGRPAPSPSPTVGSGARDAPPNDSEGPPRLLAAYPNPRAADDRGEFVLVRGGGANASLTLSDGEANVTVRPPPDADAVAVTADPAAAESLTDAPVVGVDSLSLANAGERLVLRRDGRATDETTYSSAPEGERWVRATADGRRPVRGAWRWVPLGLDPRPVASFGPTDATAFVLPDAPGPPVETLRGAEERVLLAGYTFTDRRVADALAAAAARGATVRVLVDDAPVGGLTAREAAVLDSLVRRGVDVRVVGGDTARFRFHHAKYAVVDDRAVVLTENWKPAGTGGRSSRGWGVRLDSRAVAAELAGLFRSDAEGRDATPWSAFRRGRTFAEADAADGRFPTRTRPAPVSADRVRVLTAPGNAESAVVRTIDAADERVDVIQPTVGGRDQPMLRAAVRAARRGVAVRVLLSGAWYVAEENRALAEQLNGLAADADLPLSARVADPDGRYEKVHAKGLVADDTVVVGSLNWNNVSARENREVAVALSGGDAAAYYREVFAADWEASRGGPDGDGGAGADGSRRVPLGVVVGAGVAAALAARALRRIEFGE